MRKLSFSDVLAILGLILAILLVVLDKAEKLTSLPLLLAMLSIAAAMGVPLAFNMPYVAHATPGAPKNRRRLLALTVPVAIWALVAYWIYPGEKEQPPPLIPSLDVMYNLPAKEFEFVNRGASNIYVWVTKYAGDAVVEPKDMPDVAVTISANGGTYHIYSDKLDAAIRSDATRINDIDAHIPYWVFITMDDQRQRILHYQLWIRMHNGAVKVDTQNLGVEIKRFKPS